MSAAYGCMAEFDRPEALLQAARTLSSRGYTRLEAHTPFPVEGLSQALGVRASWLPRIMCAGGVLGALATLAIEFYSAIWNYPIDVGGRPNASWPAFVPEAIEVALLAAALAGVIAMLRSSDLPRLHHPVFEIDGFNRATRDRLFLVVRSEDPRFDDESVAAELRALDPIRIERVSA